MKTPEDEIFARVLSSRGLASDAKREVFLNPDYSLLHDPFLLPDMKPAVSRLMQAKENDEQVCIYGDYDVDGLSATALLLDAFEHFGIRASSYIPNRFTEGYGMSADGIESIAESGATLIVTVDCGSKSLEEVKLANQLGLDVIITDHHTLGDELPDALAVINPKRSDSKYPFNDLAGVGVAFKFVSALQTQLGGLDKGQEKWLLDLVAMGTTCDVVSLTDENRTIVHWGIEVARQGRRPGIKALSTVSATSTEEIDTSVFGYRFGPRLNATGRLETAQAGLDLLTAKDGAKANELALQLDSLNTQRRAIQSKIHDEALLQALEFTEDDVLVLADEGWSHGVVGIVASKVVEQFHKPTFIIQIIGEEAKGSARSFGDFNLAKALHALSKYTIKGGGHAMAAGVTLKTTNIDKFRQAINKYYRDQKLGDQSHHAHIKAEVELDDLSGLTKQLISKLAELEPYGAGNEKPIFKASARIEDYRLVGSDKKHIKLQLADKNDVKIDAIGFNLARQLPNKAKSADIYFTVELNTFRNISKVQLNLVQIDPHK